MRKIMVALVMVIEAAMVGALVWAYTHPETVTAYYAHHGWLP